jgi:uncharacterized protein
MQFPFIGVDYGSKLSGTTVVANFDGAKWTFAHSEKKKDADQFLLEWVSQRQPEQIFLDAPLSLPAVYAQNTDKDDYFYRAADRALGAMSPMFLGGLTARAMRLKQQFLKLGAQTYEAYPGALARELGLTAAGYKKEEAALPDLLQLLAPELPLPVAPELVVNRHAFDALLAWITGWRYLQGKNLQFGDPEEGVIFV